MVSVLVERFELNFVKLTKDYLTITSNQFVSDTKGMAELKVLVSLRMGIH
jgi:hypothetical protein